MRSIIFFLLLFDTVFSLQKPITRITTTQNDSEIVVTSVRDQVNLGRKDDAREDLDNTMGGYIRNNIWAEKTITSIFSKDSVLKSKRIFLDVKKERCFSDILTIYYPNGKIKESKEYSMGKIGLYNSLSYNDGNYAITPYSKLAVFKEFYSNGFTESESFYVDTTLLVEKTYYQLGEDIKKIKRFVSGNIATVQRFSKDGECESDVLLILSYQLHYYKSIGVAILLMVVAAFFFLGRTILRRKKR